MRESRGRAANECKTLQSTPSSRNKFYPSVFVTIWSEVQTLDAAIAEDAQFVQNIARFGEPYAPPSTPNPINNADDKTALNTETTMTFAEVVDEFRETFMLTDLKITTRKGYESVLQANLLPRFGHWPIDKVNGKDAADLDLVLTKRRLTRATRNNTQLVLRSVLRYAKGREYIDDAPKNLPSLKTVGQTVREIPTDEQVDRILAKAILAHRLTFTLMSDAGLRPNEVRALRCKDVQLKWQNGEAIGGFITVREGRSHGEIHTPKTGQREIPISRALAKLLAMVVRQGSRHDHVALCEGSKPWGQSGIDAAFRRTCKHARIEGFSVYCLRHYAITSWLRAGIPVHVVQRMAGHTNLSTTQRYVHGLKSDLEGAARRLPSRHVANEVTA
ncbi:MAG TPA: site-specific integrase [Polyangium sp.]|nr:site-specific integrase [Polyangium sp.]